MTLSFFIIAIWVLFAFICSKIAKRKGRNPVTWFYLGFFFGLLGLIIIALLPSRHFQNLSYQKATVSQSFDDPDNTPITIGPDPIYEEIRKKNWYYLDTHQTQFGPMSFEAFKAAYLEGRINLSNYVWNEEMVDWKKLQELSEYHKFLGIDLEHPKSAH
jgi:energy-coupling factor transporter transmembrane protein EcfT